MMEEVTAVLAIADEDIKKVAPKEDREQRKLTDWENEPTVDDLKLDYTEAQSDHSEQETKISGWLDNLFVRGGAARPKVKGKSSIQPKLIRKQAEWRYSSLSEPFLSTPDLFNAAPVTFEDRKAAQQNELVLNHQFNNQIRKTKFIDEYVRAATDEGTVIVRVGWDFEEEEQMVPVEVPIMGVVPVRDPMQAQAMVAQGIEPVEEIQVGVEIEMQPQMVTIRNQPTLEVCDYRNVIFDPTCLGDIDKAEFAIYRFETNMSDLEKDGKYSNLDQIDFENAEPGTDTDTESSSGSSTSSFRFKDKPRKKLTAYEYWGFWDKDNTGIVKPFVATWVGDVMIRMEDNPFPDKKLPFVIEQYLPVRKSLYGEPDGELLEDNQKIIGAVTRGMMDVMGRSANGQQGYRKDALDLTNKRKFEAGKDYEFNAQVDPNSAFFMHTYPEIGQSAPFMLQLQNNEAESLTGVKAFSGTQGLSGAALGDSVGGIKTTMDATAKREMGILRRLANGIIEIGRKISAMNGEFLSDTEVIRITNEEFIEIQRDDLNGQFDITLTISTAEADNEKAQELAFMLQTMGPNQDPQITKIVQSEIARLRKMPELAKMIQEYEPQPDPIAQERAQLENELIKAQIARENSIAMENQSEVNVDQSTAAKNYAEAEKLKSEKDAIDLDFVEEESGTKHQRDLEKQSQQARANTRMKLVEGAMKQRQEVVKAEANKDNKKKE